MGDADAERPGWPVSVESRPIYLCIWPYISAILARGSSDLGREVLPRPFRAWPYFMHYCQVWGG
jgi:hypothetical protein